MTSSSSTETSQSSNYPVRDEWLRQWNEEILEPELPIVDPHHHLWDRGARRYLLHELLDDLNSGHRIVATVFLQCRSMHKADGPEEFRPVGETEFVNGIAATSVSGGFGPSRVCAGMVGYADLGLGRHVQAVLERCSDSGVPRERQWESCLLHSGLWPAWRPTRCAVVDLPQHSRRRTGRGLSGQPTVAPHGVTCYIRRLPVAHNASPEAMTPAAAVGMVLPHGYTFVDAYVWLRMADVRSLATALRTTVALSSLHAILQADHHRRSEGTAAERDPTGTTI